MKFGVYVLQQLSFSNTMPCAKRRSEALKDFKQWSGCHFIRLKKNILWLQIAEVECLRLGKVGADIAIRRLLNSCAKSWL